MSRSVKKGPYVDAKLLKKVEAMNKANEKRVMKTWSRRSTISPEFVGHTASAWATEAMISNRAEVRILWSVSASRASVLYRVGLALMRTSRSARVG